MTLELRCPTDTQSFQAYYHFRWMHLRAPWDQPPGSERDDRDGDAFHLMALEADRLVGVGRLHKVDPHTGQIRYMAVDENRRGQGVGRRLLAALEQHARSRGMHRIVLHARERSVGFYQRAGYRLVERSHCLFGAIQHYRMEKHLAPEDA